MALAQYPVVRNIPAYVAKPFVSLQFRLLREGEVNTDEKSLRFFRDWESLGNVALAFMADAGLGEYTNIVTVDLAVLQSISWLVIGRDDVLPRVARVSYLSLSAGGTYTFNITGVEGGGNAGEPATLSGVVRAGGVLANREVIVIERPADGEWRMAGYGPTPGGSGEIDVRVVGGDVYAIAVDDYGVAFVGDLAVSVGQRIRPSIYAGWLYEVTEPGTLPPAEPLWWAAVGDNASRPLGTARAIAVRYYQPLAHGPVPVEVI